MVGRGQTIKSYLIIALVSVTFVMTAFGGVVYILELEHSSYQNTLQRLSLATDYSEFELEKLVTDTAQLSSALVTAPPLKRLLTEQRESQRNKIKRQSQELNTYLEEQIELLQANDKSILSITTLDPDRYVVSTTDKHSNISGIIKPDDYVVISRTFQSLKFKLTELREVPVLVLNQRFKSENNEYYELIICRSLTEVFGQLPSAALNTLPIYSFVVFQSDSSNHYVALLNTNQPNNHAELYELNTWFDQRLSKWLNDWNEKGGKGQFDLTSEGQENSYLGFTSPNPSLKIAILTVGRLPQPIWTTITFWTKIAWVLIIGGLIAFAIGKLLSKRITETIEQLIFSTHTALKGNHPQHITARFKETQNLRDAIEKLEEKMQTALTCANLNQEFVLESIPEGVVIFDAQGEILKVNPAFTQMTNFDRTQLIGTNVNNLLNEHDQYLLMGLVFKMLSDSDDRYKAEPKDVTIICNDQSEVITSSRVTKLVMSGKVVFLMVLTDVTDKIIYQRKLEHLALHDPLTDLPKMMLASERLEAAINTAKRASTQVAVMFVDLDLFKPINDQYGHAAGDLVLRVVATRMKDSLRGSDTVARVGGDEFLIIAPDVKDSAQALILGQKINHVIEQFIDIGYEKVKVGASVGISMFPASSNNKEMLIALADEAMYRVKAEGRQGCRLHSSCVNDESDNITVLYSQNHSQSAQSSRSKKK